MKILDSAHQSDYREWIDLWRMWPGREVFAHPDYLTSYAEPGVKIMAAVGRFPDGGIIFPFIMRPLTLERWHTSGSELNDIISPYGYGGAFYWGSVDQAGYWREFETWAARNSIVSCFVRLSLFGDQILEFPGTIEERSLNIVRPLAADMASINADYEHKVRKNVKRAIRDGVSVEADETGRHLEDFLHIYYSTMERCDARDDYYFGEPFFKNIITNLPGQYCFFHARLSTEIVASELVLVSNDHIYSFLGGTLASAFESRPNDLLKHAIIEWGAASGKRAFVLGGGYDGQDGIFRYKKSFAPNGICRFKVAKRIFDEDAYELLVNERVSFEALESSDWVPGGSFFPLYRAPAPSLTHSEV